MKLFNKKGQANSEVGDFLGKVVIIAIITILGLAFLNIILSFVNGFQSSPFIDPTSSIIIGLVPLFYVLLIVAIIVVLIIFKFKMANN